MPGLELILMLGAMIAIFYFLLIRPQKKRMQEHQATLDALQPGSRVLLTNGTFATLSHVGERQAIVELAPGVEVTMVKSSIARVAKDDEEEFELTDEDFVEDEAEATELPSAEDTVAEENLEFDPRPESNN